MKKKKTRKQKPIKRQTLDHVFNIKMSETLMADIAARAAVHGMSAASWCRLALDHALRNMELGV